MGNLYWCIYCIVIAFIFIWLGVNIGIGLAISHGPAEACEMLRATILICP